MSIAISVRDYRGIERADITLAPIALAAGQNEQGKSCLAEAVRAALAGVAIPIPGIAKKDAKLLVRDGAEKGSAAATAGDVTSTVSWPKAELKMTDSANNSPFCSEFAVGLSHLFDLDDKARANVLAGYVDSLPCVTDLASVMRDAGYGDKAIDQTWSSVSEPGGWDSTHKKARDYGIKLKGQWEAVTGEKYGAKKAEGWTPEGHPGETFERKTTFDPSGEMEPREHLAAAVVHCQNVLEHLIGLRAVGDANLEGLKEKAATIAALEKQEKAARKISDQHYEAAQALKVAAKPSVPTEPMSCPCCNAGLELSKDSKSLVEVTSKPTKKEIAAAQAAIEQHNQALTDANAAFQSAYNEHQALETQLREARQAKLKLDEMTQKGSGTATEADVEEARAHLATAQREQRAYDAKLQADKLHTDIGRNEKLVDILAPDGLRRRKLAAGLDAFNQVLADLCEAAKWPAVRLDETLQPHYGTRPVWAASASGRWRARVVVQLAMAKQDGSAAVVIDEADILDFKGRNQLFGMLKHAGIRALVCMTVNKPALVPDLAQAGIGESYWIAAGIAEAIGEEKVAA